MIRITKIPVTEEDTDILKVRTLVFQSKSLMQLLRNESLKR